MNEKLTYQAPKELSREEILSILSNPQCSIADRAEALVAGIFSEESTEFIGDLLIKTFENANCSTKEQTFTLFGSFYGVRGSAYRHNDIVRLLETFSQSRPSIQAAIKEEIEYLCEHRDMFAKHDTQ